MPVTDILPLAAADSGVDAAKALALGLGTGFGAIGPGIGVGYLIGKTIESTAESRWICAFARPLASKVTMSPRRGQVVAHSSPSGANARSSTRVLLKWLNVSFSGSKISIPSPEDT